MEADMHIQLKQNRAQSTLEYIILVTAVIVIVIGLVASPSSPFRKTLNSTFNEGIQKLDDVGSKWSKSINAE
jgi:uncharacterized protein (UPF0333 family)